MRRKIELLRVKDKTSVEAYLVTLSQNHVNDFNNLWLEQLRKFKQEDKYWDWLFKLNFISKQNNYEGYAIECENQTQGLMMIETQMHGSWIKTGKRVIYIEGIASAPSNRVQIKNLPMFRGVGTALLKFARIRSVELGYEGRIGLHSLPEVEKFYENQNMINCGRDDDEDLVYFEYPPLNKNQYNKD